jgi:hypothetical protein
MVSSRTLLSAELLPPIEILQAAKDCVSQNVRIAGTELCQSVARALGFQRVENELRETIQRVIVKAVGTSFIADDTGSYSLKV